MLITNILWSVKIGIIKFIKYSEIIIKFKKKNQIQENNYINENISKSTSKSPKKKFNLDRTNTTIEQEDKVTA